MPDIEVIEVSVKVSLPKKTIDSYRAMEENGMQGYTDEQIVECLAEDILDRYFHEEYFDLESIASALS